MIQLGGVGTQFLRILKAVTVFYIDMYFFVPNKCVYHFINVIAKRPAIQLKIFPILISGYSVGQQLDSVANLPLRQRAAVENACQEIEWLLEDEISSALRRQVPITEESLDRVAAHICSNPESKNCVVQKEYFNFVTGLGGKGSSGLMLFFAELDNVTFDYSLKEVCETFVLFVTIINKNIDRLGPSGLLTGKKLTKVNIRSSIHIQNVRNSGIWLL